MPRARLPGGRAEHTVAFIANPFRRVLAHAAHYGIISSAHALPTVAERVAFKTFVAALGAPPPESATRMQFCNREVAGRTVSDCIKCAAADTRMPRSTGAQCMPSSLVHGRYNLDSRGQGSFLWKQLPFLARGAPPLLVLGRTDQLADHLRHALRVVGYPDLALPSRLAVGYMNSQTRRQQQPLLRGSNASLQRDGPSTAVSPEWYDDASAQHVVDLFAADFRTFGFSTDYRQMRSTALADGSVPALAVVTANLIRRLSACDDGNARRCCGSKENQLAACQLVELAELDELAELASLPKTGLF